MKFNVEIESMLESYFKQARIEVSKEDLSKFATIVEDCRDGKPLAHLKEKEIEDLIEKYDIKDVWQELYDQIVKDLDNYIKDMDSGNFSNKNFDKVSDFLIEVDEYFGDELSEEQHNEILSGDIISKINAEDETNPENVARKVAEYYKIDFCNSKNFANKKFEILKFNKPWKTANSVEELWSILKESDIWDDKTIKCNGKVIPDQDLFGWADEDSEYEGYALALQDVKTGDLISDEDAIKHINSLCENYCNSKNFGNAVSSDLPPSIDNFLQDLAQMHGVFTYSEIMNFKPSDTDMKQLKKLMKNYKDSAEVDDEEACHVIADEVASIIKNYSLKLPVRARNSKNFSRKNFNDEKYPDEESATTKVNFDGTKLPVRARFTMENPRY